MTTVRSYQPTPAWETQQATKPPTENGTSIKIYNIYYICYNYYYYQKWNLDQDSKKRSMRRTDAFNRKTEGVHKGAHVPKTRHKPSQF